MMRLPQFIQSNNIRYYRLILEWIFMIAKEYIYLIFILESMFTSDREQ